ncbi:type VI secretion system baseplate subunit TssF [Arenibaculum pallidiluteum]|uniref:type VI secretion system baseplate subunit TssF n=1 Tax=Arenibaculum pallidiluteum TaxID=2812559 RepID=UPI001A964D3B|nr:type VI secretion system baseplate subunit TssF [Arenibaculum pallidiluteum]
MTDRLVAFYDQELVHLRRAAAEFAKAHPAQAGRLRLTGDAVEDPHVARLMEAFAYLTARVRLKLDDDFPELTEALLGILYPHYLAPLPSVTVVQFSPRPGLPGPVELPAGTELDSEALDEGRCRFRTCYPVMLLPVALASATLRARPVAAPANPSAQGVAAVLRLVFETAAPGGFAALAPGTLRLFLRGAPQQAHGLYDLLAGHVVSVAAAASATDRDPVILGPEAVRPVGFEPGEAVLPADPRVAPGYRLLTEYFAWPEKFLFFDLAGLERACAGRAGRLELFLYLDRTSQQLEREVGTESFALGCTPAVNLFRLRAEPIALDHRQREYRVVPDARRPRGLEIHAIDRVAASSPDGRQAEYAPFYGRRGSAGEQPRYWHAVRRPGPPTNPGTEVFLSVVDPGFDPDAPAGHVLSVEVTCLNRDLPARLPFGGGHPRLSPVLGAAAVATVSCLTPPSRTLRPATFGQDRWRLISHLSLNHLSLLDGQDGPEPLRRLLRLYDLRDAPETRMLIDGLTGVQVRPGTARAPQPGTGALCRGLDVTLELDPQRFAGTSMLLFAGVLERFLALHAGINAFTRLAVRARGRTEIMKRWPARAGERILL